jgi:hypothetical protein
MRTLVLSVLAASALAACQQKAEPAAPAPAPAVQSAAPAAPQTAEERRADLQAESAERQIEAQMSVQSAPAQ